MRQHRMPFQRFGPQPGAKTTRVGIAQHLAVTHHQVHVIVFFRGQLFAQDTQASRHPKVDDNPAVGQFQQQIFSAAAYAEHRNVAQTIDLFRNGPAQAPVAHNGVQDGGSHQVRLNAAAAGFYFR